MDVLRQVFSVLVQSQKRMRAIISVERLALTPQHTLHVVRVNGRELVVATYPQGCTLLVERSLEQTSDRTIGACA